MADGSGLNSIEISEHISPDATGDNIGAKRAAGFSFDGSNWQRNPLQFIDKAFDYVVFTNADANGNYQTWTFKTGGSSGTTVRTITVTYDASSNITSLARS